MSTNNAGRKRSHTGGAFTKRNGKKFYLKSRQPANTHIGETRVRTIRTRGGNSKERALRLKECAVTFPSTGAVYNVEISNVEYHPSSNELQRTNTITKSAVVKVLAAPFEPEFAKDSRCASDAGLMTLKQTGHLYAIITSRPGQEGRAEGYVLQGEELAFYLRKIMSKKGKSATAFFERMESLNRSRATA